MIKKNQFLTLAVAIFTAIIALSACSGTKKFDYASAYKFSKISHVQKTEKEPIVEEKIVDVPLLASAEEMALAKTQEEAMETSAQQLLEKTGIAKAGEKLDEAEVKARVNQMSGKEKRVFRKTLKKELKNMELDLASSHHSVEGISETSKVNRLSGNTRTGVILGGIGIILLLISALFAAYPLNLVGVLLIIAGVVFILVDVI
ncbi:MAG: hypothetical protein ACFCUU_16925 [Cyclobacteriaceae bacterium]